MRPSTLIPFLTLASASASPALITTNQFLAIAPKSSSCANPPAAGECATAAEAVPLINDAFARYQVESLGEQAALLSLMAFETLDFKYNRNHFPGVAGQGSTSPFYFLFFSCFILIIDGKRVICNIPPSTDNTRSQSLNSGTACFKKIM